MPTRPALAAALDRDLALIDRTIRQLDRITRLMRRRVVRGEVKDGLMYDKLERELARWIDLRRRASLAACLRATEKPREVLPC